jgi:hypothetical protein
MALLPKTGLRPLPFELPQFTSAALAAQAARVAAGVLHVPQLLPRYASAVDDPVSELPETPPPRKPTAGEVNFPHNPGFAGGLDRLVEIRQYFRDLGSGVVDVPGPGKPASTAIEEILKKQIGEFMARPFKIVNNSLGSSLDTAGRSEPADRFVVRQPNRRLPGDIVIRPGQFGQLSDEALARLVAVYLRRAQITGRTESNLPALLAELERRSSTGRPLTSDAELLQSVRDRADRLRQLAGLVLLPNDDPQLPALPAGSADP